MRHPAPARGRLPSRVPDVPEPPPTGPLGGGGRWRAVELTEGVGGGVAWGIRWLISYILLHS